MPKLSNKHERDVWEQFWEKKGELSKVYSPSSRIIDNLTSVTVLKGKRILEVGAGTGRTSYELAQAGAQVIVLDYAENSVRMVQEIFSNINKDVEIIQADAFHLPFKEGTLDIVFHQGLLEHFKTPQPLLQENYRVLRDGGLALVDVPQRFHIYTAIKHVMIWLNAWFAGWETEFSIGELKRLMQNAGFQITYFYGEWMRPSLLYRMVREVLLKIGITSPLHPKGLKLLQKIRLALRNAFMKFPLAIYTYLDIGVIGCKSKAEVEEKAKVKTHL